MWDMVWDSSRSRFFASAGNNIVMINPETAQIEDTIPLGAEADRIAESDDGQYIYASLGSAGLIRRYQVASHALDLEISLGRDSQGRYLLAAAMVVLPGQPKSILIARGYWPGIYQQVIANQDLVVFDDAVQRSGTFASNVSSLYVRPVDGSIYGSGKGQIYWISIDSKGVSITQAVAVPFPVDVPPTWSGDYATDGAGDLFDLKAGTIVGQAGLSPNNFYHNAVAEPARNSIFVAQGD
jgi:hypothetical protein